MVRINGLFHLLINGIYWGYNPLILTFDPNFQRDIQVLHKKAWIYQSFGAEIPSRLKNTKNSISSELNIPNASQVITLQLNTVLE